MKKLYIGSNCKMYKNIAETCAYLKELGKLTANLNRGEVELFFIPSYTTLSQAAPIAKEGDILLGAQNMFWEDEGPYTGEVSPLMLREVGVQIVEIGHSERRHLMGETDEQENRKVLAALRHGFTALLCVGETAAQKERGVSDEILALQLKIALHQVPQDALSRLWVAYEPVWAIGEAGQPAAPEYVQPRHRRIRAVLLELFGEAGRTVPILHGGSVHAGNARELYALADVDGLFIGRSAWDAQNFNKIIRSLLEL